MKLHTTILKFLIVLTFGLSPVVSFSQKDRQSNGSQLSVPDERWKEGGVFTGYKPEDELLQFRTENSKTFKNPNGTNSALFVGAVHYKDVNGFWQDIDKSIMPSSKIGYAFENVNNSIKSYFPSNSNGSVLLDIAGNQISIWNQKNISLERNGQVVSSLDYSNVSPQMVNTNELRYNNVVQGLDEQFYAIESGIKYNSILTVKPTLLSNAEQGDMIYLSQTIHLNNGYNVLVDGEVKNSNFTCDHFSIGIPGIANSLDFGDINIFMNSNLNSTETRLETKIKEISGAHSKYSIHFISSDLVEIRLILPTSLVLNESSYPIVVDPTITVGSTASGYTGLFDGYFTDCKNQSIYLSTELVAAGIVNGCIISAIDSYCTAASCAGPLQGCNVRLRTTSGTAFSSTSFNNTGYTSYYTGTITPVASSWTNCAFTSNYTFNSSSNLDVEMVMDQASYDCFFSHDSYARYTVTGNRNLYYLWTSDASPLTATGTGIYTSLMPTLKFTYSNGPIVATSSMTAFTSCPSTASTSQSFTVSGTNMAAGITVTAPTGFQVSTDNSTWSISGGNVTVGAAGTIASTTVYARMASLVSAPASSNIVCSSSGATSVNVAVSGSLKSSPTITTTTASSITSSSASSGGVSISAGSGTISAKGVCYAASPTTNPTTSNSTVSGGTGTANFTSALTSLSAATRYYYNAYATNECGTSYGIVANFWTLSTEPTGHSTTFSATAVSPTQINLSFLPASTYGADGYIILVFQGASAPTSAGVTDGVAPGSLIGFSPTGATYLCTTSASATSYSHTTCSILSQYYYTLIPFNWNEVNTETYNYLTTATIPTCTATTLTGPSTEGYYISGNIVNNGTINETSDINYLRMTGSSKTISGTGTWTGAKLCIDGTISFGGAALTSVVNAGSTITELFVLSNTFTLYANQTFPVTNITNYATITDQTGSTLNVENTNNYNALNLNGTGIINNTVNWVNGTNGTVTVAATGKINVGGNWTNNGTFTAGTGTVEFNGNNSLQTASGSGATAFYNVIVNKGSNASNVLEANGLGALSNSGNITITNGVFKMTTGIWQFNAAPTIPSTGGLIVNGATLNSGNFSYTNNGLIRVLSGTAAFGTASDNELTNQNAALFDVQGGTVSFSGRLYNSANGTAPTGYSSTGVSISGTPTITICSVGNNSGSLASFHMTTTSNLSFTGGTVILQNPNTNGTPFNDIEILSGGTKSISGGTFQIGNASTATAKTFIVNSAIPIYNFTVNATNSPKVNLVTSNLTVSSTLAMNGGDVTMSTDATVLGTLTLSAGKLVVAGGKTLSIGNNSTNGTISGGSSSSYIVAYKDLTTAATGTLKRFVNTEENTLYELPIGDAISYTPMTFRLASATLLNAYISVFTKAAKIATMNASVTNYLNRYWDLTPSGITGTVDYRVDYTYATGDVVGVETSFFPVKRSLISTSPDVYAWYKPPATIFSTGTEEGTVGSVDISSNILSWRGLSTFSQFSAAGNQVVNLPIDLLSFDAKKQNQNNLLFWSTATETNCDYFTIEKTLDGTSYEVVGNVNGGGTSFDQLDYSLVDYDVRKAINYYRLKQTDTDGAEKISALVSVDNRENLGKVISMKTNLLGQEINENYRGVVIVIFEDGTSIKIIQ